jgi:allophanate hydrolase subunit 1
LPAVLPLGEGGWTVSLGTTLNPATHQAVLSLAERAEAAELAGITEIIPAYVTLTVRFDPTRGDAEGIRGWLERAVRSVGPVGSVGSGPSGQSLRIPVRYDGPDLLEVAERTGLSASEVIERHSSREYRVYLLGFAPGFAFLGDLDPALFLHLRSSPLK